jgi:hypothetical protein
MKSILLKEELQRISEMMNISPKLIIEGITPSKASEEFLGKLIGGKSSAEAADEIINRIRRGETGVADKTAASEAFGKFLEKEVYTDVERTFVTKIIDKLFPEFVRAENGKLVGVIRNLRPEVQRVYAGLLSDFSVPAETVARTISDGTGAKILPETVQFYRNKLKNIPIEIPNVGTSGVSSRTSSRASDEIILDIPSFEIKPELENIARNAGIDSRGLSQAVQKDMANESMSRADIIRLEIMEESGKLDLKSKSEALRFKKELNELDLVAKEEKIKLDKLDRDIKELEIKAKNNSINSKEKLDLIEYKSAKQKLLNQRIETISKIKWIFGSLAILSGGIWIFAKRCDWFPSVCEWFNTNQMDDSKSNGGSKSKGGSKKSINDY